MKKRTITRRDFLRAAALTPVAGAIACRQKQPSGQEVLTPPVNKVEADKVKVVLIRDKNALAGFKKPDEAVVERMLNEAMTSLFGVDDLVQAWKEIVGPDDIVGIKLKAS
jgi:hypothetical protein